MRTCEVLSLCLFFFFQAEDGIRDVAVTGVQTCALPISVDRAEQYADVCVAEQWRLAKQDLRGADQALARLRGATSPRDSRSEERRVGKECRSRWSPYH